MRWFTGAVLILALALTFQLGLLAYAMYVLLGIMLVSRVMSRVWIENLVAERECNRLIGQCRRSGGGGGQVFATAARCRLRGC